MTFVAFQGAVELGFIYALLALGSFVSYRVLNIADMTVDGSFTTGAALSAVCAIAGLPALGLPAAIVGGAAAGAVTALMQTKLKVQPILAGIITMTALYSINLKILGTANLSLFQIDNIFTHFGAARVALIVLIVLASAAALGLFFHTRTGLSVRATGDNEEMVRTSSINTDFTKTVGLCISNALAGLSGALLAQYQSFANINMGTGMVIIALASLIIGEAIFGRRCVPLSILAVLVGSIIYRIIMALVLSSDTDPSDLKLISAIIVAAAVSYPALREKWDYWGRRRGAKRDAQLGNNSNREQGDQEKRGGEHS